MAKNKNYDKDNWHNHWERFSGAATINPAQKLRHNLLLRNIKKCNLLIDIGSGQGDFIKKASEEKIAKKLIGFELSDSGVRISKNKVPSALFYKIDFYSNNKTIDNYLGSADTVICSDVIEHVDNPIKFCSIIKKYMKKNGRLLITVPGGPMSQFDQHIGHRKHYNQKSIRDLLEKSGFKIEKIVMAGFPFFNLYRLVVILRGKKLILDVDTNNKNKSNKFLSFFVMKIFDILFQFNINLIPLGWQVFVIATPSK
jgi:2-polyprenyl-3-methyl-5-hydroxy-6-metoxy-1,4-benzoquinol methylase